MYKKNDAGDTGFVSREVEEKVNKQENRLFKSQEPIEEEKARKWTRTKTGGGGGGVEEERRGKEIS